MGSWTFGRDAVAEVNSIGDVMSICRHDVAIWLMVRGICRVSILSISERLIGERSMFGELCGVICMIDVVRKNRKSGGAFT